MGDDPRPLAIKVLLEEHSVLRAELLELLKWRERLVFFSLAMSGALFSFASTKATETISGELSPLLALYLVSPLCSAMGGLWLVNTWRMERIGMYIREILSVRVNEIIRTMSESSHIPGIFPVLSWEISTQRMKFQWQRHLFESIWILAIFVLAGVIGQYLIWQKTSGCFWQRVANLDYPIVYLANCFFLAIFAVAFILSNPLPFSIQKGKKS